MCAADPQRRFTNKCWVWVMAGQIAEMYRLARDERKQGADSAGARVTTYDAHI